MAKLQIYDKEILETNFTNEVLLKINEIEITFGFNEFELTKKLIELLCYTINQYHSQTRKSKIQRDSKIKKDLINLNEKLNEIREIFKFSSLKFHLSITNFDNHELVIQFQNSLPKIINETQKAINSLKDDNGGRTPYSLQRFLTFHLFYIFAEGTKKKPKCSWTSSKKNGETGSGEGYKFLVEMREILPKISPYLILSPDNKTLCNCGEAILSDFEKLEAFTYTTET